MTDKGIYEPTLNFSEGRVNISWRDDEATYHVWLDYERGTPIGSPFQSNAAVVIYKNPPRDIKPSDPGYFRTRYLRFSVKKNAQTVKQMLRKVDFHAEKAAHEKLVADQLAAQERKRKADRKVHDIESAGPRLLRLLRRVVDGMDKSYHGAVISHDLVEDIETTIRGLDNDDD